MQHDYQGLEQEARQELRPRPDLPSCLDGPLSRSLM